MAALARLHAAGSVSQNVKEEAGQRKLAAQYIQRELFEADEANLLDEEEFCKSLISRAEIVPEFEFSAINKKPLRKERKKMMITHNHQAISQRERKKFASVNSESIAGTGSYLDEQVQITQLAEAKGNRQVSGSCCINGSSVGPYNMNYPENVALHSSKPLKGETAEAPSNLGTKKFCMTTAGVVPYVPAPLATKVYYSQRSHYLRRAIRLMYYEGSNKECSSEYPNVEVLPVNAVSNSCYDPAVNQQRDNHILHLAQEPHQIALKSPEMQLGKSEGFVPAMNISSQLPVNNTVGLHYMPKSYSFAGNSLGTVQ